MADIFDPMRFTTCGTKCTPTENAQKNAANEKSTFLKVLGKVTSVDSSSKTIQKARELVDISNRVYESGMVPERFKTGITGVVDHFGINDALSAADKFNPVAANGVKATVDTISTKVRSGNLKFKDMSGLVSDISNLNKYASNIFSSPNDPEENCVCDATNFAQYVADKYFPKYTSLYAVKFEFAPSFRTDAGIQQFEFLCTKVSRPTLKFELEEVNKYNNRIFVPKKTSYEPLNLEFIDDNKNHVWSFMRLYTGALVPSSNLNDVLRESQIFAFDVDNATLPVYASSLAPMAAKYTNDSFYIKSITVYHMFAYGNQVNMYRYFNPTLEQVDVSDLTAEGADISKINTTFRYSHVYMDSFNLLENSTDFDFDFSFNRGDDLGTILGGNLSRSAKIAKMTVTQTTQNGTFFSNLRDNLKNALKEKSQNALNSLKKFAIDSGKFVSDKVQQFTSDVKNSAIGKAVTGAMSSTADAVKGFVQKALPSFDTDLSAGGLHINMSGIDSIKNKIVNSEIGQLVKKSIPVKTINSVTTAPPSAAGIPESSKAIISDTASFNDMIEGSNAPL